MKLYTDLMYAKDSKYMYEESQSGGHRRAHYVSLILGTTASTQFGTEHLNMTMIRFNDEQEKRCDA